MPLISGYEALKKQREDGVEVPTNFLLIIKTFNLIMFSFLFFIN